LVLDGAGAQKYISKTGAGSNVDPFVDPAAALPTGAATSAQQIVGNDVLASIEATLVAGHPVTVTGVATAANQTTGNSALGAAADAEATGDGSIIAVLKRLRTLLGTIASALAGTLSVAPPTRTLTTVTGTRSTSGDGTAILSAPSAGTHRVLVNWEVNPKEATTTILLKSGSTVKRTWTLAQNSLYANDLPRGNELHMGSAEAVYLNLDADSDTNYAFDYFTIAD
jgi:hypothetical protein